MIDFNCETLAEPGGTRHRVESGTFTPWQVPFDYAQDKPRGSAMKFS